MSDFELLVFDLDGTLIDRDGALLAACGKLLGPRPAEAQGELASLVAASGNVRRLAARFQLPVDQLRKAMLEEIRPRAEVRQLLVRLRKDHGLVLYTNGSAAVQHAKIRAAGLEGCFDRYLVSGEVGLRKPDTAFLKLALGGTPAANTLVVGDDLRLDIAPAVSLGAATCLVGSAAKHEAAQSRFHVDDVLELTEVLACPAST